MLKLEDFGTIKFGPKGENIYFEYLRPYQEQQDFGRTFFIGKERAHLYGFNLIDGKQAEPLFEQRADTGYRIGEFSADDRYLVYTSLSPSEGYLAAIYDLQSGQTTELATNPDYVFEDLTVWPDSKKVIFSAISDEETPERLALFAESRERLIEKWRQHRLGKVSTSTTVGSGKYQNFLSRGEHLASTDISVDISEGQAQILAKGQFEQKAISPDGRFLAAIRLDALKLKKDQPIDHSANLGGDQRTLLIFDLNNPSEKPRELCKGCDVARGAVQWSMDGRKLAFAARPAGKEWKDLQVRIFEVETGRTRVITAEGYKSFLQYGFASLNVSLIWVGDKLVTVMQKSDITQKAKNTKTRTSDLVIIDDHQVVNLTKQFANQLPVPVGVTASSLLVLHEGNLWSISATGVAKNLTESVEEPVSLWRAPSVLPSSNEVASEPIKIVVLETSNKEKNALKKLLFVDVTDGVIDQITAPNDKSEFVAVYADTKRAVVIETDLGVKNMSVVDVQNTQTSIMTINKHLEFVRGGDPIAIKHKGPNGDERISWLLLPPNYDGKSKLPTVVEIYPGAAFGETYRGMDITTAHALNPHILVSKGYAVLRASLPVDYRKFPRDPLDNLANEVLGALDAAIEAGYVDPKRVAIQGQSFGGYSTVGVLTQTDRFKTAVATAGLYNLFSAYGVEGIQSRLMQAYDGPTMFNVGWVETGQAGMVAAPWDDPERYIRNSPLMHVKNITTPLMIMHGDYDFLTITQSEELFNALNRLGKDVLFVRYFGEGHVYTSPANIRDLWKRKLDWYDQHLMWP